MALPAASSDTSVLSWPSAAPLQSPRRAVHTTANSFCSPPPTSTCHAPRPHHRHCPGERHSIHTNAGGFPWLSSYLPSPCCQLLSLPSWRGSSATLWPPGSLRQASLQACKNGVPEPLISTLCSPVYTFLQEALLPIQGSPTAALWSLSPQPQVSHLLSCRQLEVYPADFLGNPLFCLSLSLLNDTTLFSADQRYRARLSSSCTDL